jgi:hypothetical protein
MKVTYRTVVLNLIEGELSIDPRIPLETVDELVRNKIKEEFSKKMDYRWSVASKPIQMREDDIVGVVRVND